MGPAIADQNHLARYCSPKTIDEDGVVTYLAFLLRLQEEYLSSFQLEVLQGAGLDDRLNDLRREIQERKLLVPAKSGKYAVLNVGQTRQTVNERCADRRWVRVTVEDPPPFHAGIHDTLTDEDTAAKAISDSVLSCHHS